MAVTDALRSLRASLLSGRWLLDDLLRGWRDALLFCLPASVRRVLTSGEHSLVVVPRGANVAVFQQQGAERRPIAEIGADDKAGLEAVLAGMRGHLGGTVIEVAASQVLSRMVSLPAQVRSNLDRVMQYEIDRITPFQADQVYFEFRLVDAAISGGKLPVELVVCRRDLLREWLQRLRDAGASVERITWNGAWARANLLPLEDRPQHRGGLFTLTRLLFLVALVLLSAALVTPLWQQNRELDELDGSLRAAKSEAEAVQQVRSALEQAREGSVVVLQRKLEQPLMVDLLRELTERLPNDTWVQNMDVRESEVQIRGESGQATALIGLLEKAPGISEVSFRSPVVQASSGQERFHISFNYTREAPQ